MAASSRSGWLRRALLALLPTLLVLALVEAGSRAICRHRFASLGTKLRIQGDSRWVADDSLIWTNRPLYLEYDRSAQYNEHGMRVAPGHVRLPPKEENELRIFCLGGSTMAGVGSSQKGDWLKITGVATHPISQSIDGLLQEILERALPGTRVRVFNVAVASHALPQSRVMYRELRHLEPDWIISMDGVNDPPALADSETAWDRLEARWQRHPVNRRPLRVARGLMRNSAFFFLLGERVFFRTGIIRTSREAGRVPEVHDFWLKNETPPRPAPPPAPTAEQRRAVDAFVETLSRFHRELVEDGQKHLLLVQPHLSLRDPSRLRGTERALYNYYMHLHEGRADLFMTSLHQRVAADFAWVPEVVSLASLHHSGGWIFLDYCHLTAEANRMIGAELARRILAHDRRPRPAPLT